jgi:hypothetical protein
MTAMGLRDRYRQGWAVDRYTSRTWFICAAIFAAYIAGGVLLAVSDFDPIIRVCGAALAVVSVAPVVIALRQAPRSNKT